MLKKNLVDYRKVVVISQTFGKFFNSKRICKLPQQIRRPRNFRFENRRQI